MCAMESVGSILINYDYDKQIPIYGFGGVLPSYSSSVSHCFPLSGNDKEPNVGSIEELIALYKKQNKAIDLDGPTYFEPVLKKFVGQVKESKERGDKSYTIAMIITDGCIGDFEETRNLLVEAS